MMTLKFKVLDKTTGKEPDLRKIALNEEWAKHLIYTNVDCFAIDEDGTLILLDSCGHSVCCPVNRFEVVFEKKPHLLQNTAREALRRHLKNSSAKWGETGIEYLMWEIVLLNKLAEHKTTTGLISSVLSQVAQGWYHWPGGAEREVFVEMDEWLERYDQWKQEQG